VWHTPLVWGRKKNAKLLPVFKGFQHLVSQQEGRQGLVWLGTLQCEEELGQGFCAKIKLPRVQSVRRECNSSTGLLLQSFLQQGCCCRTFFSLGQRLFGDGTQIPWDRNSKHFAFSWIAKVYVCVCMYVCMCMCMCVYKWGNKIRSCIFGSPQCLCFDCVRREERKKRAVKESFLRVKFEVLEQGCWRW
jgi:hypothetical protein